MKCMLFYFMKEDTGHCRREVSLPLVTFDPSKSCSSTFNTVCTSVHNFNSRFGADVSYHKHNNSDDKKCALSLPKKVRSF